MPVYPVLAILAALAVVVLELRVLRTGIFRQPAYWLALAIVFAFMVPVDGWLTKLSAPSSCTAKPTPPGSGPCGTSSPRSSPTPSP